MQILSLFLKYRNLDFSELLRQLLLKFLKVTKSAIVMGDVGNISLPVLVQLLLIFDLCTIGNLGWLRVRKLIILSIKG
jgi:hypothetical protein